MLSMPALLNPIPAQIINVGAGFFPVDLKTYIQSPNEESGIVTFKAELSDGRSLPQGMMCTSDGILTGIPAAGTEGRYQVVLIADNDSGIPLITEFDLLIKERIEIQEGPLDELKARVWEAVENDMPVPDIISLINRPISAADIDYLLQRFATLTIWNADNLDRAGDKVLLQLEDSSPHYHVYDRGSCIIGTPTDLFSHERTLEDAFQTSRAIAREVYKRGWVIEFAGFKKMVRAAWAELQLLGEQNEKYLQIINYLPKEEDFRAYSSRSQSAGFKP